jgi:hypothetical protein
VETKIAVALDETETKPLKIKNRKPLRRKVTVPLRTTSMMSLSKRNRLISTRQADFNCAGLYTDVLYHEVKFKVDTSANATPAFNLSLLNVNDSGNFYDEPNENARSADHACPTSVTSGGSDKSKSRQPGPRATAANVVLAGLKLPGPCHVRYFADSDRTADIAAGPVRAMNVLGAAQPFPVPMMAGLSLPGILTDSQTL